MNLPKCMLISSKDILKKFLRWIKWNLSFMASDYGWFFSLLLLKSTNLLLAQWLLDRGFSSPATLNGKVGKDDKWMDGWIPTNIFASAGLWAQHQLHRHFQLFCKCVIMKIQHIWIFNNLMTSEWSKPHVPTLIVGGPVIRGCTHTAENCCFCVHWSMFVCKSGEV